MKRPGSTWRVLAAVAVVIAIVLVATWFKQRSAEKLAQEQLAAQSQKKSPGKPKPPAAVPDRPGRERGSRP